MRGGFETLLFAGAMIAFACSGGPDQGPVVGPGPGPTEPGEGVERGDNPFDFLATSSNSSGETIGANSTVTTGSGMCSTCNDVLNGNIGVELCPGSEEAYVAFVGCACDGNCTDDCSDSVCAGIGLTSTCEDCLDLECRDDLSTCEIN